MRGRGRQISEFEASLVYRVPGQPRLHRETLSQKIKKKKKNLGRRSVPGNHRSRVYVKGEGSRLVEVQDEAKRLQVRSHNVRDRKSVV